MDYIESKWQPFMGDCSLCAELLAEKNNYSPWIIVKYLDGLLRGFSQVIFSNNPVSGFLFLLAFICVSPIKASVAIITGTLGIIWSVIIGHKPSTVSAGLTTYNPILLGCFAHHAVPTLYSNFQLHIWISLVIGVIICVYLATAINGFLSKWNVPCLTLPFILVEYLLILSVFNNYTNPVTILQNVTDNTDNRVSLQNIIINQEPLSPISSTTVQLLKEDENNKPFENTTSSIRMFEKELETNGARNERTNKIAHLLAVEAATARFTFTNVTDNTDNRVSLQNNIIKQEPPAPAPLSSTTVQLLKEDENSMPFENTTSSIRTIMSSMLEKEVENNGTPSERTNDEAHLVAVTTSSTSIRNTTSTPEVSATSILYDSNNSSGNVLVTETATPDSVMSTNLTTYPLNSQPTPLALSSEIETNMTNDDISGVNFGKIFAGTVHSAGALLAIDSTFLSAIIYLAIVIYSPIMGACSFLGAFIGTLTAILLLNVPVEECYWGLWGYNSLLISAALCGMTWVIKIQTVLACFFCILFGVLIQYVLNFLFVNTTLIQYNLAFNFGVISFMCMTQIVGDSFPQPEVHTFPEKHRYDFVYSMKSRHDRELVGSGDDEFYVKRVSIVKFGTDDSHLVGGD